MMRHARASGGLVASAAGTLAIGIVLAGAGCFSSNSSPDDSEVLTALCPSSAPTTRAGAKPAAIGLLGEDQLLTRFSLTSGRVEAERKLPIGEIPGSDPAAAWHDFPGPLLVQPAHAGVVLVLARRASSRGDEVLAVDPVTLRTRCRYSLARGVRYRGIDVGDSNRIYAFGYREGRDPKKVASVLTTVEPVRDSRPVTETVRAPNADWFPYWGAVAPDERHVVLSYHGGDTSGADALEAAGDGFRRCPPRECGAYEVHGAVAPYGDGFLATDGGGMLEVSWTGRIVERLPGWPRLVHLMDFALDTSRRLAYVSTCGEHPAIRRIDLAKMRVEAVSSGRFCGAALAVYGDRYLVLAAGRVDGAGFPPLPSPELRVIDLWHPGPGTLVSDFGVPQDAIALSTVR